MTGQNTLSEHTEKQRIQKESQTPFEKYEALTKLTHRLKKKSKTRKLDKVFSDLKKLCCSTENHLLNSLSYEQKILRKKHGK